MILVILIGLFLSSNSLVTITLPIAVCFPQLHENEWSRYEAVLKNQGIPKRRRVSTMSLRSDEDGGSQFVLDGIENFHDDAGGEQTRDFISERFDDDDYDDDYPDDDSEGGISTLTFSPHSIKSFWSSQTSLGRLNSDARSISTMSRRHSIKESYRKTSLQLWYSLSEHLFYEEELKAETMEGFLNFSKSCMFPALQQPFQSYGEFVNFLEGLLGDLHVHGVQIKRPSMGCLNHLSNFCGLVSGLAPIDIIDADPSTFKSINCSSTKSLSLSFLSGPLIQPYSSIFGHPILGSSLSSFAHRLYQITNLRRLRMQVSNSESIRFVTRLVANMPRLNDIELIFEPVSMISPASNYSRIDMHQIVHEGEEGVDISRLFSFKRLNERLLLELALSMRSSEREFTLTLRKAPPQLGTILGLCVRERVRKIAFINNVGLDAMANYLSPVLKLYDMHKRVGRVESAGVIVSTLELFTSSQEILDTKKRIRNAFSHVSMLNHLIVGIPNADTISLLSGWLSNGQMISSLGIRTLELHLYSDAAANAPEWLNIVRFMASMSRLSTLRIIDKRAVSTDAQPWQLIPSLFQIGHPHLMELSIVSLFINDSISRDQMKQVFPSIWRASLNGDFIFN